MRKILLIAALALITIQVVAQETNTSLRPAIKVEKAFSNKFSLELAHQTRYFTNLKEFERFTMSLEGNYAISKRWSTGLAYLWLYNHNIEEDFYANRNRYHIYLKYKQTFGDWSFSIREKFKTTYYNKAKDNPSFSPKNVLLTKVEVAYQIKSISLTPYISGKLRYMVNHPTKNQFNQYRWSVGAQYKINNLLGVDLYFEQRGDLNVDNPGKVNIIGTALKFSI